MLKLATLSGTVFMALAAGAVASEPDPGGVWQRSDGNARVKVEPCGNDWCATNIWVKDTSAGEAVGDRLIMSVKPVDGDTLGGKAYDPKRDMSFKISIDVQESRLATRGCMIGGMLCKSVSWTKVAGN